MDRGLFDAVVRQARDAGVDEAEKRGGRAGRPTAVGSAWMRDIEIERRLREAGAVFSEAHERAARAIREAADAGMPDEAISHVSELSPETVRAFLRAGTGE